MAVTTDTLQQFILERLRAFLPSLDVSTGSPVYSQVINPLLARLGTDPFSTDVRSFLLDTLAREFPDLDVTGAGSETGDVLVSALEVILTPLRRAIRNVKLTQSVANPELLTAEELDALMANFLEVRQAGDRARQAVRLYFSERRAVLIDGTVTAWSASGLAYYAVDVFTVTADELAQNVEGGYYFLDIVFEAESEGDAYNVDAHQIMRVDGVPGLVKVDNKLKFSTGVAAETNESALTRAETAVSERTPTTASGITQAITGQVDAIRGVQVIGYGDIEMRRDIIKGTVTLDETKLGLGPLILNGTDGVGVSVNLGLPTLAITDKTNLFQSATVAINTLVAGNALEIESVERGIAGVIDGGPSYKVTLDDFEVVITGTNATTVQPLISSIDLHLPQAVQLESNASNFAALGVAVGDWLRVSGTWDAPKQWSTANLALGAGNLRTSYFPITEVNAGYIRVGPTLLGDIHKYGGLEVSSLGSKHNGLTVVGYNAKLCFRLTYSNLVGTLVVDDVVKLTAGLAQFGTIEHISTSTTTILVRVTNIAIAPSAAAGITTGNGATFTVSAVLDPDTSFASAPAAQVGDFLVMEKPGGFATQEWRIVEVTNSRQVKLGHQLHYTGSVVLAEGNTLTNAANNVFGTVSFVDNDEKWVVVNVSNSANLPGNGAVFHKQGTAGDLTTDATAGSEAPSTSSASDIVWAVRKGPDNPSVGAGGALPKKFLLGNASATEWAVIRYRADIDPDTYDFLSPTAVDQSFSARTRMTLADVVGSVSMTISDVPAAVTFPNTLQGPISVGAGDEVHVGGCADAYVFQANSLESLADFIPSTDEEPLTQSELTLGSKLTISAGTDIASSDQFAEVSLAVNDVVVILEGEYAGPYRVIRSFGGTVRLDGTFTNGVSGARFYVSRDATIALDQPRTWRITQGTALRTFLHSVDVLDTSENFGARGVEAGDTLEILEGEDKGTFTIESVVSATELKLTGQLSAPATGVAYRIYRTLSPISFPFRRITKIDLLDASGDTSGITIPYAKPVDVRSLGLSNIGHGGKLTGTTGATTDTNTFQVAGADLVSLGISSGDILYIQTGASKGAYVVQSVSGATLDIHTREPLNQSFLAVESNLEFVIGSASTGTFRCYFLDPTVFGVIDSAELRTKFTALDGREFVPDYIQRWNYLTVEGETNVTICGSGIIKVPYDTLAGGVFAAGNLLRNDTAAADVGTILFGETGVLWVRRSSGGNVPADNNALSSGVVTALANGAATTYADGIADPDTDFEAYGTQIGDRVEVLSVAIDSYRDLPSGANVSGLPFSVMVGGGPTQTVTLVGTNPISLSSLVDQIQDAFDGVTASEDGHYLTLYSNSLLEIGTDAVANFLLGFVAGDTNAPLSGNTIALQVGSIPHKHVLVLQTLDQVSVDLTTELNATVRLSRPGMQRFGPLDMVAGAGLYYVDVEVRSIYPGDAYNLVVDSELTAEDFVSYGYWLEGRNDVFAFSPIEQVNLRLTSLVLDAELEDSLPATTPVPNKGIRLTIEGVDAVGDAQSILLLDSGRCVNSNPLARHMLPAYVYMDVSYQGGSSADILTTDLKALVDQTAPTVALEVSDIYDTFRNRNANTVYGPVELVAVRHNVDRTINTIRSKDRLVVGRTSHLLSGNVKATRL